ncbi:MAG: glycosyltransferase, partial [Sphingobacteriales bacterium]
MLWPYLILYVYIFTLSLILIFSIGQAYLIYFYLRNKIQSPTIQNLKPTQQPLVTVQLPLYNEVYVVAQLINAVCALNYPIQKLEIQVLDDSDDECYTLAQQLVKAKQAEGFNIQHICRKINTGFKAGALQHGLQLAKGEFIAIFDADFIPEKEFLNQLLPFFTPNVGM